MGVIHIVTSPDENIFTIESSDQFKIIKSIVLQHLFGFTVAPYSLPRRNILELVFTDEVTIETYIEEAIKELAESLPQEVFPLEAFEVIVTRQDEVVVVDIYLTLKNGQNGSIIITL